MNSEWRVGWRSVTTTSKETSYAAESVTKCKAGGENISGYNRRHAVAPRHNDERSDCCDDPPKEDLSGPTKKRPNWVGEEASPFDEDVRQAPTEQSREDAPKNEIQNEVLAESHSAS
jgi:hypothetical protein